MPAAWPFGSHVTAPTHPLSAALTAAWFHVPSPGTHCDGRLPPANQGLLGWVGRRPGGQRPAAGMARRGHCCGHQKIAPRCKIPLCTKKPSLPGQAPCPYHQRIRAIASTPVVVQTSRAGSRGISAIPPAHTCTPTVPSVPCHMHSQRGTRDPLHPPGPREVCRARQGLQGSGAKGMEKQERGADKTSGGGLPPS